jgi:hypothetical protein
LNKAPKEAAFLRKAPQEPVSKGAAGADPESQTKLGRCGDGRAAAAPACP